MPWLLTSPGHQQPWHDIYYTEYVGPYLIWGRILSMCVISMWRNDIKCKDMFRFTLKNLARKGLSHQSTFRRVIDWVKRILVIQGDKIQLPANMIYKTKICQDNCFHGSSSSIRGDVNNRAGMVWESAANTRTSHVAIAIADLDRLWWDWTLVTWQGLHMVDNSWCMRKLWKNEWVRHVIKQTKIDVSWKIIVMRSHVFSVTLRWNTATTTFPMWRMTLNCPQIWYLRQKYICCFQKNNK